MQDTVRAWSWDMVNRLGGGDEENVLEKLLWGEWQP